MYIAISDRLIFGNYLIEKLLHGSNKITKEEFLDFQNAFCDRIKRYDLINYGPADVDEFCDLSLGTILFKSKDLPEDTYVITDRKGLWLDLLDNLDRLFRCGIKKELIPFISVVAIDIIKKYDKFYRNTPEDITKILIIYDNYIDHVHNAESEDNKQLFKIKATTVGNILDILGYDESKYTEYVSLDELIASIIE